MIKNLLAATVLTTTAQMAFAEDFDAQSQDSKESSTPKGLYVGGGINYNSIDLDSIFSGLDRETAPGFQLFAGLPIPSSITGFNTFAEFGYFQTDTFNFAGQKERVRGVWGAGVLQRDLNEIDPNLYALARAGLEVGDDDGVFMGIGAGYRVNSKVDVRAEFLNKDLLTSYQLNALIRF